MLTLTLQLQLVNRRVRPSSAHPEPLKPFTKCQNYSVFFQTQQIEFALYHFILKIRALARE